MHADAPHAHLEHHRPAVAAVMRRTADKAAVPLCALVVARAAGLIAWSAADRWQLTSVGSDLMTSY